MKLAVIAGAGDLPQKVISLAQTTHNVHVIGLKGLCDDALATSARFYLTEIESIIAYLKSEGIAHLILVGKVERAALAAGPIDATAQAILAQALPQGDNAALMAMMAVLNQAGLQVIPTAQVMPGHIIPSDYHCDVSQEAQDTLQVAQACHNALSPYDVGQSLMVQGAHIVAIEAAEGTDEMIARSAPFLSSDMPCRLFLKGSKKSQNKLLDPPVFGKETLAALQKAGVTHIALEELYCLLADPLEDIEAACHAANIILMSYRQST